MQALSLRVIVPLVHVALLLLLAACGAPTTGTVPAAPTQLTIHGGLVRDQVSLIDALRKAGASVDIKEPIEQPFLSVKGTRVVLNGASIQFFEYADDAAAQADLAHLTDIIAGRGTAMVSWVGTPHVYRAGRVIALYVGDDAQVVSALTAALGAQAACE